MEIELLYSIANLLGSGNHNITFTPQAQFPFCTFIMGSGIKPKPKTQPKKLNPDSVGLTRLAYQLLLTIVIEVYYANFKPVTIS